MKLTANGVLITTDVVIEFFRDYPSPSIAESFDNLVVSFVKTMKDGIKQFSSESQLDRDREALKGIMASFEERMMTKFKDTSSQVVEKMDMKMDNLMSNMNAAIDKIGLSTLSTTLNTSLKDWLDGGDFKLSIHEILQDKIGGPLEAIKAHMRDDMPPLMEKKLREGLITLDKELVQIREHVQMHTKDGTTMKMDIDHALSVIDTQVKEVRQNMGTQHQLETISGDIVNIMYKKKYSIREKGIDGEDVFKEGLTSRLMDRDGYSVVNVNGDAKSCDLLVRRKMIGTQKFPDIRIDNKKYTSTVPMKEITKFKGDLDLHNCHGIMISMTTGIVGKGNTIDIEQLANGKLAIYLSNIGENVDMVIDAMAIIYRFHEIMKISTEDNNTNIVLTATAISRLRTLIAEFTEKLWNVKIKMKDTMKLLNDVHDTLLKQLLSAISGEINQGEETPTEESTTVICPICRRQFASNRGYQTHQRTCSKKQIIDAQNQEGALDVDTTSSSDESESEENDIHTPPPPSHGHGKIEKYFTVK